MLERREQLLNMSAGIAGATEELIRNKLSVVDDMVLSSNFDNKKLEEIVDIEKNISFHLNAGYEILSYFKDAITNVN
jgi:hypothetical protein